jgi:hypothetical protein
MLFFRSEEHVDRWCATWRLPRGYSMTLDENWRLAQAWYGGGRTAPEWRRRTPDETREVFARLGLTSDFWAI